MSSVKTAKTKHYTQRELDRIWNSYGRRIKDLEKLDEYQFKRNKKLGVKIDYSKEQPLPKGLKRTKSKGYFYDKKSGLYCVEVIFNGKKYLVGICFSPEIAYKIFLIARARIKHFEEMAKRNYIKS